MGKRSKSSGRWLSEHHADPYVKRARKEGQRSRAVYKLEELDQALHLLRPGMTVLDLGAAPGGFSQYARRMVGAHGRVLATDLLPMEPIPGVEFVQGDFREEAVLASLKAALAGHPVDLVMSDMAPNMAGVDAIDQPRALYLAELALALASEVLKPGGTLLVKVFQGAGFEALLGETRRHFNAVRLKKPPASRARSAEMYLVASGRRFV